MTVVPTMMMRTGLKHRGKSAARAALAVCAALAVLAAFIVLAAPAQAQDRPQAGSARAMLGAELRQMRGDMEGLARLAAWQQELLRAARSDPAGALRQRRPMADCLASALAPLCGELTSLFQPGTGTEVPGEPEIGTADDQGMTERHRP